MVGQLPRKLQKHAGTRRSHLISLLDPDHFWARPVSSVEILLPRYTTFLVTYFSNEHCPWREKKKKRKKILFYRILAFSRVEVNCSVGSNGIKMEFSYDCQTNTSYIWFGACM